MTAEEKIRERLRVETPYYAEHCLRIVDKRARLVPLAPRLAQLKLDAALEGQRAAGLPMRAIVLKSRKVGISTWVQGKLLQRATQRPNRRALVVAQDNDTAGELFDIGYGMYVNLPDEPWLRPPLAGRRNSKSGDKYLRWGQRAAMAREVGDLGLNSTLEISSAKEVEGGRGKTITDLHASEVAFWPDPRKALSLLNAVPDEPETLVILESTANGHNFFKARWDRAVRGEGGFVPVFIGWTEDEDCTRAFPSDEAREAFIATIGDGPWGEDEPRLVEKFGATPEQLNWRRYTIVDKCDGKLDSFNQEYPNEAQDAFIGSGKLVFSSFFVRQVHDRVEHVKALAPDDGGPQSGVLLPSGVRTRKLAYSEVEVPTGALWTPAQATGFGLAHPWWTVYRHPAKEPTAEEKAAAEREGLKAPTAGQYVIGVDVAGDEQATSTGDRAFHAIQVIDHRTREQVACWRGRMDPDLAAREALLAGLYYNTALIAVEVTGGWGIPVAKLLWKGYGYNRVFMRRPVESKREKTQDRLGWSTDRRTKPLMEATMHEALRTGTDGIRDVQTAHELDTYVKDERGNHGPDTDCFSDLLMALMIAQAVADLEPIRHAVSGGQRHNTMTRSF